MMEYCIVLIRGLDATGWRVLHNEWRMRPGVRASDGEGENGNVVDKLANDIGIE